MFPSSSSFLLGTVSDIEVSICPGDESEGLSVVLTEGLKPNRATRMRAGVLGSQPKAVRDLSSSPASPPEMALERLLMPPRTRSPADDGCIFCFLIFYALRVLPCSQFLRLFFSLCNESWKLRLVVGMFQRTQDVSELQTLFFALIRVS